MKLKYNFTSLYKQNQAVLLKINGRFFGGRLGKILELL